MRISSDRQRKAMFANMSKFSNKFHMRPYEDEVSCPMECIGSEIDKRNRKREDKINAINGLLESGRLTDDQSEVLLRNRKLLESGVEFSDVPNRYVIEKMQRDIAKLKDYDDKVGFVEVPHHFEDRHQLENLEIDAAIKPIGDEVGRHRKLWNKLPETKSYDKKYPLIHPRGVSLGEYVDESPPDVIYLSQKPKKHPQKVGSSWEGDEFKHGPRIMQPSRFVFIRTVEPDDKYRHYVGGDKIPDKLPKGAKLVIGKLKGGNAWGVQSVLTPKD